MSELRNIIDMRRYYAKTVFGFAVAKTNLPVSRLPDAAEFKSFEALEIQHEQLDAMSVFRREALKRCLRCGVAFSSASNNAKYCPDCRAAVQRRQKADYARKRRVGVEK